MAERRENARRQQEHLEEMKLRFFTNISHEFRTPLTLILTPLGSLIKQQSDVDLKQRLVVIYRNAEKLLQLVNQLLDFRKLEMQGERLSVRMGDIVHIAKPDELVYIRFVLVGCKRVAEKQNHVDFVI